MGSQPDQESLIASLRSVSSGAVIFMSGSGFSKVLGFVFHFILTQYLRTQIYGIYALSYTILTILSDLGTLGASRATLRFLPAEIENGQRKSVTFFLSIVSAMVGSGAIAAALFWFAPLLSKRTLNSPLFVDVLRVFAVIIPFQALTEVGLTVFRSQERLEYQVFVRDIIKPTLKLSTTGIAVLLAASLVGLAAAITVAVILVFAYTVYLLLTKTNVRPAVNGCRNKAGSFFDFSLPLVIKDVGGLMVTRIDILMIGFLLTGSNVGIYNIAVLLSGVLLFPLRGINQLVPPIVSRLYEDGDLDQIQSIYSTASRWGFIITLLPTIGIIVHRKAILSVFGTSYVLGGASLVILSLGYLVKSAAGPSGYTLMMTDHQYLLLFNQFLMAVLNVILNYVLILRFGILGAAIATSATRMLINQLRVVEAWYFEGLFPYSIAFLKPILAGIMTFIALSTIERAVPGGIAAVTGAIIGPFVFAVLIYLFGLEEIDQQFLTALRSKYRSL